MTDPLAAIAGMLSRDGFAFVRAPEMQALLETAGLRDWGSFAATWDDLGVDAYMADGGRHRRRDRAQAASAALSEPGLQPAQRWPRTLVRAGHRGGCAPPGPDRDPER